MMAQLRPLPLTVMVRRSLFVTATGNRLTLRISLQDFFNTAAKFLTWMKFVRTFYVSVSICRGSSDTPWLFSLA